MWMRSCAVCKALLHRLRDFVRYQRRWIGKAIGIRREVDMAKVIEFYIPACFQRPLKVAPQAQAGKIVEFCLPTKKSA